MKKVFVFCVVILVIIAPSILFLGCDGLECVVPTGREYYYVSFVLDGPAIDPENVILNFGSVKGGPEITVYQDDDSMVISAFWCPYSWGGHSIFLLDCHLLFDTRGDYIGTYGDQGTTIGQFYSRYTIKEDGQLYEYHMVDGSLTITSFGDVGGDVIGTFNLTLEGDVPSAPSYGLSLTAIGEFRVIRIEDSYRYEIAP